MVLRIVDKSEQKKYTKKHKLIEKFLIKNNKENLYRIDSQLVEFSELEEKVSKTETLEELFNIEFIPHIPPNIDLDLFFNQKDKALVIIEIKSPSKSQSAFADYKTFGQILYYITRTINYLDEKKTVKQTVKHVSGDEVKTVRGIILAEENSVHKSLNMLIDKYKNILPEISLRTYRCIDKKDIIINDV